ncbi:WecB/TagA/CpsF family glycosyltransferase [Companilactobacillus versmoldensis]|uniref:N-acetylglucosaminyldiphosphoundecaprenol N-acetyl-beta-D-mannosaminyltransferase n=1 Tax=Companilactobacillus versmoldensis DSM 14857 = KCTC 3814 TaxID=1423815 RepID=A0A0R1SHG7_9LACO|nr:WecB/TagA/CpsF family glycosyltransferase [Companilactobacillus versmoldensis]KRL66154.1 N-acetylglucosaminyldiphosphoundecaprenol N-acetyl-beta-D-mannosaminyltransferase [Companilactobacillus versmoldensis DSM 14857 = KCTC 3814]
MHNNRINILGTEFDNFTEEEFHQLLKTDLSQHANKFIVTPNPEIVLSARENTRFSNIVNNADYVIPDGIGIIKGANMLDTPMHERLTGFDTLMFLIKQANEQHAKVYLLGAKPEVINASVARIKREFPKIDLVGYHDGYFKDDQKIADDIIEKNPDIVLVALGSPKQEFFINQYRDQCDAIWIGVGGSFDVFSGTKKRAPKIFQKLGLEWLYRLAKEPTRFGRMLAIPKYLHLIKKAKKQKN